MGNWVPLHRTGWRGGLRPEWHVDGSVCDDGFGFLLINVHGLRSYKWCHPVLIFLFLSSLSIIISRSIYVAANGIISFFFCCVVFHCIRFPWWLSGKESACQTGDWSLIPGLGRSPGEGNGNPFQYSCLRSPMDRGAWQAKSMGLQKNLNRLSG